MQKKLRTAGGPMREEGVMTSDGREAGRHCPGRLRGVRLGARRGCRNPSATDSPFGRMTAWDVAPLMAAGSMSARLAAVRTAVPLHPDAQAGDVARLADSRVPIRRTGMIQLPAPPVVD